MSRSAYTEKLALGTAQFGLNYGISNVEGQTPIDEVEKVLIVASNNRINLLDTAYSYGASEMVLGRLLSHYAFDVVSKFPSPDGQNNIADYINESLNRLGINSLYAYMAHHAEVLIMRPSLWDDLVALRTKGLMRKIGYSLYTPLQLEKLIDLDLIPDIVQIPYSVFDRRFETLLPDLKKQGIEIHTRSAFLQGLFFVNPDSLPSFFDPVKSFIKQIKERYRNTKNLSGALLYFCLKNQYIDKVIVGVNNAGQLQDNIESLETGQLEIDWDAFKFIDESILLPYNWPGK